MRRLIGLVAVAATMLNALVAPARAAAEPGCGEVHPAAPGDGAGASVPHAGGAVYTHVVDCIIGEARYAGHNVVVARASATAGGHPTRVAECRYTTAKLTNDVNNLLDTS